VYLDVRSMKQRDDNTPCTYNMNTRDLYIRNKSKITYTGNAFEKQKENHVMRFLFCHVLCAIRIHHIVHTHTHTHTHIAHTRASEGKTSRYKKIVIVQSYNNNNIHKKFKYYITTCKCLHPFGNC